MIFGAESSGSEDREKLRELHAKISELTVERDFLSGSAREITRLLRVDEKAPARIEVDRRSYDGNCN
jgi:hypothetical protein